MERRRFFSSWGALVFLSFMFILTLPFTGHAATFTVNSIADGVDATPGDGACLTATTVCTLRAAVQEANALAGADIISLPAGTYVLNIPGAAEDLAATGDLDISALGGALTINGAGAATTIIDGGDLDRVFETTLATTNATISGVTIRNGLSNDGLGGCVSIGGNTTMTLSNAVVTACTAAAGGGGGVDVTGTLTMTNVAVTNNTSASGGIDNGVAGTVTWTNGTLSGNSDRGFNNSGTLVMTNVTISGNSTLGDGAGLDNDGSATLLNCTITGNTAPPNAPPTNIGGIRATGPVSVKNTIIANNTPTNCGGGVTATPLNSQGNNISDNVCLTTVQPGDLVNVNPELGPLANNGGDLQTHALLVSTAAIDAGAAAGCPATDARGVVRPVDGNIPLDGTATCDIGAFEFRPRKITTTPASPFNFGTITSGTTSDQIVTVTNGGDSNLIITSVAAAQLTAPFTMPANNCAGVTLAPAASCTLTVRFSPTSAAATPDTFDIVSDDPLTPTMTFSVSGVGTATIVSNIAVTDSVAPADDRTVAFGNIAVGATSDATITITAGGSANLVIGAIAGIDPLAAPFSITSNTCTAPLAPSQTCTLTVRFAPTGNVASSDTFDIPNNDPDTPTITITLTGFGVSASGNTPPSVPILVSPANSATVAGTSVALTWQRSTDVDGDAVTYHVTNCANAAFTGCTPVDVASAGASGLMYAGMGSLGAGVIMIGFVFGSGFKRSRKALLMLIAVFLTGALFMSCSKDDDGPAPPAEAQFTVSGLTPATTYFWKVVADDGRGGTATSEVRSYRTQ